jgi:hypothetical protein
MKSLFIRLDRLIKETSMAEIVRLQDRKSSKKPPVKRRPVTGDAKVLLFTGIRYERRDNFVIGSLSQNRG